jgi:hypothetical protein
MKIVRKAVKTFPVLHQFDDWWIVPRICSVIIYNKKSNEREVSLHRLMREEDGRYSRQTAIRMYNERVHERTRNKLAQADLDMTDILDLLPHHGLCCSYILYVKSINRWVVAIRHTTPPVESSPDILKGDSWP